tara:strand:- start:80 stop:367 length:288 start_codon:yes stop_codon:yes gene_type:complete
MKTITIEIEDHQYKAMEYVAVSPEEWSKNAVKNRCRKAVDEIVNKYTNRALDEGVQIPKSKELIVDDAYERKWVVTAKQQTKDAENSKKALSESE